MDIFGHTIRTMKLNIAKHAGGLFLLAAVATTQAQSTWNYFISDAGGGNSLVTWSVTGDLVTPSGAAWMSVGPFLAVPISAPGIYADSYVADGTPQSLPTPDGSYLLDLVGGKQGLLSGYYALNAAGSSDDGFGLMVGLFSTRLGDHLTYNAGTQSALIPIPYSDFNPGTYQSQIPGYGFAMTMNLTVGVVPEPSTVTLLVLGGLNGLLLLRCRE